MYGVGGVGCRIGAGGACLAATGVSSLLYAELALAAIAVGLILLRVARIGRRR